MLEALNHLKIDNYEIMKIKYNLAATAAILISISCFSQDHTVWRNGTDGVCAETGLLDKWPESGPDIIWAFEELGQGHSSPVIFGDYIYITGMTDGTGFLFKFDLNGKLIYKKEYGPEFNESYHGPRGSPVIQMI